MPWLFLAPFLAFALLSMLLSLRSLGCLSDEGERARPSVAVRGVFAKRAHFTVLGWRYRRWSFISLGLGMLVLVAWTVYELAC